MRKRLISMQKRAEARFGIARRAATATAVVALAGLSNLANAAIDQVTFDGWLADGKADIGIAGLGFLGLCVAVAIWRYVKRAAN